MAMTTGEVTKRLGVHANTIRLWADEYSRFLSPGALGQSPNNRREYTDDDLRVLATIHEKRSKGLPHDQIEGILLTGQRVDTLPAAPTPAEVEARKSVALVLRSDYEHALDQVQMLQTDIARLTDERNAALMARDRDTVALNQQIADLRAELGRAQGRLESIDKERPSAVFWLRIIGAIVLVSALLLVAAVLLARGG
jgi:DNA-binding transcriptional MerR regulator